MSLRMSFSQGEDIFSSSEYWFFTGMSVALPSSCQTMARKWWGMPFLINSWSTQTSKRTNEYTEHLCGLNVLWDSFVLFFLHSAHYDRSLSTLVVLLLLFFCSHTLPWLIFAVSAFIHLPFPRVYFFCDEGHTEVGVVLEQQTHNQLIYQCAHYHTLQPKTVYYHGWDGEGTCHRPDMPHTQTPPS